MIFSEERILRILLQTVGAEMPKLLAPEDKFVRVVAAWSMAIDHNKMRAFNFSLE